MLKIVDVVGANMSSSDSPQMFYTGTRAVDKRGDMCIYVKSLEPIPRNSNLKIEWDQNTSEYVARIDNVANEINGYSDVDFDFPAANSYGWVYIRTPL